LVRRSLLAWCGGPVDLVLANLPYLTPEQLAANPALAAEPAMALDGGREGLELVDALVADLPRVLAPDGAAGLELDPSQTERIARRLGALFPDARVRVLRDLAGLRRHVVMSRPADG
jgi:release factor glutamine methyltransferase